MSNISKCNLQISLRKGKEMISVKKLMNNVVVKGLGKFGDMMNDMPCIFVLYQPKSYKRGEREKKKERKEGGREGERNRKKKELKTKMKINCI